MRQKIFQPLGLHYTVFPAADPHCAARTPPVTCAPVTCAPAWPSEPGRPGDDAHTGRRVGFTLERLVVGHLLAARETAHSPYPHNPDLTG